MKLATAHALTALICLGLGVARGGEALDIGSARELFVDRHLIDRMTGASLKLHTPQPAPPGPGPRSHGHYATVIWHDGLYRLYSRGDRIEGLHWKQDGWEKYHANEVTIYAESRDGIHWTERDIGLYKAARYPNGNIVLAGAFLVNHNFTPFLDTRPGVPADEKFKALGGLRYQKDHQHLRAQYGPGGLRAYVSADGIRWRKMREEPVIPEDWGYFDSQNVAFWSRHERRYLCYFRTFHNGLRSVMRTESLDFRSWTQPVLMNANLPGEHLYTSATHPYFRAPHIYIALPTRFQADRGDTTDIMFMTTRGGNQYDRTFPEAFIRPGLAKEAWGNRSNYAALNVVPTGPTEMSIFVLGGRRYTLRYDGFASVNAPYAGGEMVTKLLTFSGKTLEINYSTSAGGSIRVEIQDAAGKPAPGFALEDCPMIIGDEIARGVTWKAGGDVSRLAGKPVRLRFVMQDADLFSLRFTGGAGDGQ